MDKIAECRIAQKACVSDASGAHCEACPAGKYAAESGSCAAIEGHAYSHDFSEFTMKPGEEVLGQCQSWTMNNPEEIWFNAVTIASAKHVVAIAGEVVTIAASIVATLA